MFAITGVTGHVGPHAAEALLGKGEAVRVVVRDSAKAVPWKARGADVAVADLGDAVALAAAFQGCEGAFVLLPVIPAEHDLDGQHRRMADAIADAVRDSGVPHVVMLSSIGADRPDGTGPIRWLHHLENKLRDTGATVTAIRSPHFQEKVETVLGAATGEGIYPVFGTSADVPTAMVATRDIGFVVAESLLRPPAVSEVIDLDAPNYTERQVADALAAVLDRPLQVVTIPPGGWVGAMVGGGVPLTIAEELAELYGAEHRGLLTPAGDRVVRCSTTIEPTMREVVRHLP